MKRIKGAVIATQICLPNQKVEDFLGTIPPTLILKELYVRGFSVDRWRSTIIPKCWKQRGVVGLRENKGRREATARFTRKTKAEIIDVMNWISRTHEIPKEKFVIEKAVLSDGNTDIHFRRVLKEIREKDDHRKKRAFLGLSTPTGKIFLGNNPKYDKILDELNSQKVSCQILAETRRVTVCSEVK